MNHGNAFPAINDRKKTCMLHVTSRAGRLQRIGPGFISSRSC